MTYTCACGDSYTETIAKLSEHNYIAVKTAPTCTDKGFNTYTCECGEIYIDDYVDATGHRDENNDGFCDFCNEDISPEKHCSHICHKGGVSAFFYKIVRFFWKLFKTNRYCSCGVAHY